MALQFEKKPKRTHSLTVRITEDAFKAIREIADQYGVSQADVIEKLLEQAQTELPKKRK